eukprot:Rmarinus@m.26036
MVVYSVEDTWRDTHVHENGILVYTIQSCRERGDAATPVSLGSLFSFHRHAHYKYPLTLSLPEQTGHRAFQLVGIRLSTEKLVVLNFKGRHVGTLTHSTGESAQSCPPSVDVSRILKNETISYRIDLPKSGGYDIFRGDSLVCQMSEHYENPLNWFWGNFRSKNISFPEKLDMAEESFLILCVFLLMYGEWVGDHFCHCAHCKTLASSFTTLRSQLLPATV